MTMPNFLILGVAKAGTTSAWNYLDQHPEVFVSPLKEPNFFVYDGQNPNILPHLREEMPIVKSLEEYQDLFRYSNGHKAIGEASHLYGVDPCAAARIRHYIPNAKMIVLLRDPVERAHSAYSMMVRDGRETRSFEEAIRQELWGSYHESVEFERRNYVSVGLYAKHLKVYLDSFDRSQFAFYLFDDFRADPAGLMRAIFRFLDVDDSFIPDTSIRHNASGEPRHKWLRPLLAKSVFTKTLRRTLPEPLRRRAYVVQESWRSRAMKKPQVLPETRERLVEQYRDDILQLQKMIGRDLSGWLQ